jgi:Na+(H+)/acetate symporter ActP
MKTPTNNKKAIIFYLVGFYVILGLILAEPSMDWAIDILRQAQCEYSPCLIAGLYGIPFTFVFFWFVSSVFIASAGIYVLLEKFQEGKK